MKHWPVSTHTDYTDQADQLHSLFSRLHPQDVEDFYSSYQHWILQERIRSLQEQTATIQQYINENAHQMAALQPSSIAHATLTCLHKHGVQDVDVLDRLLEHDDQWLNHTLELLELCEYLGFIQDDYTQWCEYALEGAYDWITSINVNNQDTPYHHGDQQIDEIHASPVRAATSDPPADDMLPRATEEELLQKLMSEEDDETIKLPAVKSPVMVTQPSDDASPLETEPSDGQTNSNISPIVSLTIQPAATTRPLPAITQPLPIMKGENTIEPLVQKRDPAASTATLSSYMAVSSPQRGPLWRLFNLLARFFFAT